jgi:predicted HicB family RNase H-like nuclease
MPAPKKKPSEPLQQLVVRVTPSMHADLHRRARIEDRTLSQTVRRALRQYLTTPPPTDSI